MNKYGAEAQEMATAQQFYPQSSHFLWRNLTAPLAGESLQGQVLVFPGFERKELSIPGCWFPRRGRKAPWVAGREPELSPHTGIRGSRAWGWTLLSSRRFNLVLSFIPEGCAHPFQEPRGLHRVRIREAPPSLCRKGWGSNTGVRYNSDTMWQMVHEAAERTGLYLDELTPLRDVCMHPNLGNSEEGSLKGETELSATKV